MFDMFDIRKVIRMAYRELAYSPNEIVRLYNLGRMASAVLDVVNANFRKQTPAEYEEWKLLWKDVYAELTATSRANKQNKSVFFYTSGQLGRRFRVDPVSDDLSVRQSYAADLRKFSNTLLNAREFAKSERYKMKQLKSFKEYDDIPF